MSNNDVGVSGLLARVGRFFPEREIFLRSDGSVRFLKISTRLQIAVAGTVGLAVLAWVVATVFMLVGQYDIARDRAALDQQKAAVASSAKTVRSYRASVDEITDDLEKRQESLEELVKSHFGDTLDDGKLVGKDDSTAREAAKGDSLEARTSKISAALPEAGTLRRIETQQLAFARRLTHAVALRTARVEAAIRSFGLNPSTLIRQTRSAEGGPFIPYKGAGVNGTEEHFDTLGIALNRLDALEKGLLAIPSGRPTSVVMLSSGFGYRRDPFNGHGAFHAGLDFRGAYGQPILAAADGRVSFVGQRSGYGKVVEITHGRGIMTRYAHVSGFNSKVGQKVIRGQQVARMGSTGRSTGTHLHFEVRLNGQPINPRRFLEAKADVLEIQKIAKQRFGDAGNRG